VAATEGCPFDGAGAELALLEGEVERGILEPQAVAQRQALDAKHHVRIDAGQRLEIKGLVGPGILPAGEGGLGRTGDRGEALVEQRRQQGSDAQFADIEAGIELASRAGAGHANPAAHLAAACIERQPLERDGGRVRAQRQPAFDGKAAKTQRRRQADQRGEPLGIAGLQPQIAGNAGALFGQRDEPIEVKRQIAGGQSQQHRQALVRHALGLDQNLSALVAARFAGIGQQGGDFAGIGGVDGDHDLGRPAAPAAAGAVEAR
jgi:hypothetical protein